MLNAGAADGLAAHEPRRRNVLLEESGRDPQRRGHVVETVAGHILGKQRLHVDVDAEHAADLARVLGAVEPVQAHVAGIARALRIQTGLQPADELAHRLRSRLRLSGGWHQVAAQLSHHLFPDFRLGLHLVEGHGVERHATRPVGAVVARGATGFDELVGRGRAGLLGDRGQRECRTCQHRQHSCQACPCSDHFRANPQNSQQFPGRKQRLPKPWNHSTICPSAPLATPVFARSLESPWLAGPRGGG